MELMMGLEWANGTTERNDDGDVSTVRHICGKVDDYAAELEERWGQENLNLETWKLKGTCLKLERSDNFTKLTASPGLDVVEYGGVCVVIHHRSC